MVSSDQIPKQFDIVVVPFPYSDQLAEKRRPALVVSSNAFNKKHGLLWVVMITSASNAKKSGDILIAANSKTGLPSASLIRPSKIATIEPERVVRVIGKVDNRVKEMVLDAITKILVQSSSVRM